MRLFAPALIALHGLSGCAPISPSTADSGPQHQCFSARQINDFQPGPNRLLYLGTANRTVFEARPAGACQDLPDANALLIQSDTGFSDRICTGDWARVVIPNSSSPIAPCRVYIERRLTQAEVAALPSRSRR